MLIKPGTFSKDPTMWGLPPGTYVTRTRGTETRLNDKNWYLDWVSGLGQNLLGQTPEFLDYLAASIHQGLSPTLTHGLEHLVAEKLAEMLGVNVPGWMGQKLGVTFAKTGSGATTMAVRLARAVTGKTYILTFKDGYHGWGDWTIGRTPPAHGIIADQKVWDSDNWGDAEKLVAEYEQFPALPLAAIIFEQPAIDPPAGWYSFLRQFANQHNALLIADEVVTGLRYGLGGACERYDINPDLICLGKALGNGMPIAALVGHYVDMEHFARNDPVFCSSTTWGEPASLAAANYVLDNFTHRDVKQIWDTGEALITGLRHAGWDVFGHGARSVMQFDREVDRAFFIQGMYNERILMNRPNLPNLAHTIGDVTRTIEAAEKLAALKKYATEAQIQGAVAGKMPRVLFDNR